MNYFNNVENRFDELLKNGYINLIFLCQDKVNMRFWYQMF